MVQAIVEKIERKLSELYIYHIFRHLAPHGDDYKAAALESLPHFIKAFEWHIPDDDETPHCGDKARVRGDFADGFARVLCRGIKDAAKTWKNERLI